jgi:uncharacterized protein HemX
MSDTSHWTDRQLAAAATIVAICGALVTIGYDAGQRQQLSERLEQYQKETNIKMDLLEPREIAEEHWRRIDDQMANVRADVIEVKSDVKTLLNRNAASRSMPRFERGLQAK